ncbi:MAG: GAF domain-containing protein [Syntrophorhabdaceae bacterium]|nr:GAF domain-containing protein [Syntrophorhabdaceae bacterium]
MIDRLSQLIFNIYEAFTVAFYMREKDTLVCLSSVTFAKSFDDKKSIPVEGTLPGWVIKHNAPLIIPNFDRDEDALGYYGASEGIKSFMGYPMDTKGVIIVDSKKKYVFTDKEKKILGSFASLIHQEIEQERKALHAEETMEELYAERRILNLLSALNTSKVSTPDVLTEILGLSGGTFCFIGMEKKGRLVIQDVVGIEKDDAVKKECHPGESIASVVFEGGRELLLPHGSAYLREKSLLFPNEPFKARQFFGFPLITEDTTFGVIGFVSLDENELKQSAIGALRNLSCLLSLYFTAQWMREHLDRIRDFDPVTGAVQFPVFLSVVETMARKNERFSILCVKLGNIVLYNRKMGSEGTNDLLRRICQVIRYCAGGKAFVARKNGGRFFVLLKGGETFETRNMMKLLYHAVGKSLSEEGLSAGAGMIELGTVSYPDDSPDLWELFDRIEEKKIRKFIE